MTPAAQLSLFGAAEAVSLPAVVLADGPWGRSWLEKDAAISPANPLFFECRLCGQVSGSHEAGRLAHKTGCRHPGIGGSR